MKFKLSFVLVLILLSSCKKEKLDGDKSVLVGEWKWISTEHLTYDAWAPTDTANYTPESVGNDYFLEFQKKGKLVFRNNNDSWKKRIVFGKYAGSGHYPGYDYFGIFLNNDHTFVLEGMVNQDTIILLHNPLIDYQVSDSTSSISYFIRN